MSFQPTAGGSLIIDGVTWKFGEHPLARGMPYGQEGRQAVVYQLVSGGESRALKVFKARFRVPGLVFLGEQMARYSSLPGLSVCSRTVLTPQNHATTLRGNADLLYAVLMPWIEGPTWMQVLLEKRELSAGQSLSLARGLADVLATMEQRTVAHCDLSGPNVLLPELGGGRGLALVDVEQMFAPELRQPETLPGGSPGYAHRSVAGGLWAGNADRFAGALLLAEMLGWCDTRVRSSAWGESYFDPAEVQHACPRLEILREVLDQHWGGAVAGLLDRAWRSDTLSECATLGEWLLELPGSAPTVDRPSAALAPESIAQEPVHPGPVKPEQELPPQPQGRKALAAPECRSEAVPRDRVPRSYPSRPASTLPEAEQALIRLFDQGLAAVQAGRPAEATELLSEVERRQPGFELAGRRAADLLAQCRPQPVSPEPKGALRNIPAWLPIAGAVAALVLIIVAVRGCPGPTPLPTPTRTATARAAEATDTQAAAIETSLPSPTGTLSAAPTTTATPKPQALVEVTSAEMREGPGSDYALVRSYERGMLLDVLGRSPGQQWLKVQAPDGVVGWMKAENLTVNLTIADLSVASAPPSPTPKAARAGDTKVLGGAGITLVYVPAGSFLMGSTDAEIDAALAMCQRFYGSCPRSWFELESPRHTVGLDGYWIGQTEVTNAEYRRFVEAGGYKDSQYWSSDGWAWRSNNDIRQPEFWDDPAYNGDSYPVVGVSWFEAEAYTKWVGARLPTEAEWEKAARGTDGRTYPWGNEWDGERLNYCDSSCRFDWKDVTVNDRYAIAAPPGTYPGGASPYGGLDMAGNVWEWVRDWYDGSYYANSPPRNPTGPSYGQAKILRGGSWINSPAYVRCAIRYWFVPDSRYFYVGFRVAQ
ncbi:MAG TPA: SUMF1/EgtB/PvdO family nonheme iron enzyme [Anaerolineae bacterium]|nr:SUMF1/EgtB/PvdO family nonheme iron enzyme [Anaerolineae bacterium]